MPGSAGRRWLAGTFESFGYRDFTLFWSGALVSNVGTWMQNAALAIVVWAIEPARASLNTGIVQGLAGLPILFLAIPAGALADHVDRRKLLIWIQVVLLVQAAALGALYGAGVIGPARPLVALALVGALGLIAGIFVAFQGPAFQAFLPDLVPRKSLMNAIALNSAQFQSSRMLGPAIVAGMVLVGASMALVFYLNALSFLFVIAALLAIRPRPEFRMGHGATEGVVVASARDTLLAGVAYARAHRAIGTLLVTTALLVFLGFPYMILLTAVIQERFAGADVEQLYAVVYTLNGMGSLIGALAVASLPATLPRHRVIPLTLLAFAALVVAFGLAPSLLAMSVCSLLAGGAYMATGSLVMTSIQAAVPGQLRGRVMALYMMAFMGVMPLSAFAFGALGQAIGADTAVFLGGALLFAWALLLALRPGWLEARAPGQVHATSTTM